MRSYRSGTSTSSSSLSESRRNSGQPSTSTSTSKRPTGNHMAHWREAPRPNQHAVTHSEPIVNPQHHRHHRSQGYSSQQIRPQHHHSSSSYSGKKNLGAVDWKTEAEITVTLEPINQAMGLIRSAVGSRKISHLQPSTACLGHPVVTPRHRLSLTRIETLGRVPRPGQDQKDDPGQPRRTRRSRQERQSTLHAPTRSGTDTGRRRDGRV